MADIIRVIKSENYTAMSNYHLRDKRLSLKACGLLSKVLALPPDWEYSVNGLASICKEGREAIRNALNELSEYGYVERSGQARVGGKFTAGDYLIREIPVVDPPDPDQEDLHRGGFAATVEPPRETRHNKVLSNKLLTIDPPIAPQGAAPSSQGRRAGTAPDWKPDRFEAFWRYFPRGEGKAKARQAWNKLKPDDELIATIARALQRQKASPDWQRGIGIPYASTYLNQRRWEDEDRAGPAAEAPASPRVMRPEVEEW